MKRSKLIKLLNSIPGSDPDILFWNGFVEDWQDFDTKELVQGTLVKQTLSDYLHRVELERQMRRKNRDYKLSEEDIVELKKTYKQRIDIWEENDFITQEDVNSGQYKEKKVYYLQTKNRNKSSWDRGGKMEY